MKRFLALSLAVMMVLSTASFALPVIQDTVISINEIFADVPAAEEQTAEVAAEYPGTLIAKVDFEAAADGDAIGTSDFILVDDIGTTNAPEGFPNLYLHITGGTLNAHEDENGEMYATWYFNAAGPGWAKIGLYTDGKDEGNKFLPAGQYTLVMNQKWLECKVNSTDEETGDTVLVDKTVPNFSCTFTPNMPDGTWTNAENNYCPSVKKTNNEETGYTTLNATASLYEGQTISTNERKNFTFKGFGKAAFYLDANTTYWNKASVAVDDICLYYKAPDVTVTLDDGDAATENETFNLVSNSQSLDLAPYALASDSTKVFTGWKVEGTSDTAVTVFTPTEAGNYTLVPVYNYYAPGLGFEGTEFNDASELATKVWSHTGEKPSSTNPTFTFGLDKDAGTVLINVDYDENSTTFPATTGFNTHFYKQIDHNKILNTNAIKGIEYRYRLVAPEGAENRARYFTSSTKLDTKVYFKVNWPEGMEETECYGGEGINGWHWGECVGFPKTMVAKDNDYNGEWLTAQFNLDGFTKSAHGTTITPWKDADQCSDFRIQFVSTTGIMGDFTVEIDYVKFILQDGLTNITPEYVSSNFYDLRKGYFDVTFAEELEGIDEDEVYNIVEGSEFVASELISTEGGATYRIYAGAGLADKTVSFKDYAFTSTGVINASPALKAVTHKYTLSEVADKHDGENLFPNGDFSNPYYVVFNKADYQTTAIDNGKLKVTLTELAKEWSTLTAENVMKLNPDTHYYVDVDVEFTKDSEGEPHVKNPDVYDQATLYFPVLDGTMSFGMNTPDAGCRIGTYNYIPSTLSSLHYFQFNNDSLGADKPGIKKVIDVKNNDYYANTDNITFYTAGTAGWGKWSSTFFDKASLYLQPCFSNGKKAGFYPVNESSKLPDVAGLEYTVNKVVVKEMFPVTFKDGETVLGTYYAAKDVPITLPKSTLYVSNSGEAIVGWSDGTKTYAPEELYTLTTAGAKVLTAVTENVPITSKTISMRADAYTGIRFRASVSVKMKENEKTNEFGYIVTRQVLLNNAGVETNDFTLESDVKKLTGTAYVKGSVDKVFENNGSFNYFTAVLYNIPEGQYDDVLVARPYLVHDGVTTYGAPVSSTLRSVATALKGTSAYNELTDEMKAKVDAIVG